MTKTATKDAATKPLFHRLIAWVKSLGTSFERDRDALEMHRAMWLGKRNPAHEGKVRHYSY